MQQPRQPSQNLGQQPAKSPSLKGKEAFQKDDQRQKYHASNVGEKTTQTYKPDQNKAEEDRIDPDSLTE